MKQIDKIRLLQYENLRKHFNKLVKDVLGEDYYNLAMDVYTCDEQCCEDLRSKYKCNGKSQTCGNKEQGEK
jgi:hypothetical protein